MTPRLIYRAAAGAPRGYRAYRTKEHDGDSFWVMVDTGFGQRAEPELRLVDVTAPEVRPVEPGGVEATNFVNLWLAMAGADAPRRRWPLWVRTQMTSAYEPEMKQTFTRYLAWVSRINAAGDGPDPGSRSLNDEVSAMLAQHPDWGTGQ